MSSVSIIFLSCNLIGRARFVTMSNQMISTYFKPLKRKHEDSEGDNTDNAGSSKMRQVIIELSKNQPALSANIGLSWFKVLQDEFTKDYFNKLGKFLESERRKHEIYPPAKDIYSWTTACAISDVKVVILGQDPYHGPSQAHGLAFSVRKGVAIPKSLHNIYKELADDIPGFKKPSHGFLYGWASQGVLLLNTCLTVQAHKANSHKGAGWEQFTDAVISCISANLSNVVFILWGNNAISKLKLVDQKKHHILSSVHPSPLSASRGFFGCKHFSKANAFLEKAGKEPIKWEHLP